MKRQGYLLIVVCLASAVTGWGLAWRQASRRQHDFEENGRVAAAAKAKGPAIYFAGLVRRADEAVIVYRYSQNEAQVRLTDSIWLARLSDILGEASYAPLPLQFAVSDPEIRLYRKQDQIFSLMMLGDVLRAYSDRISGDFAVGEETTRTIRDLIREKEPAQKRSGSR